MAVTLPAVGAARAESGYAADVRIRDVDLGDVRQTDGFTCGPTSALVAAALLDPSYAAGLDTTADGLAVEQHRIHRASNRVWPRALGTTPWGVAAAISRHSAALGLRYGWRPFRGRRDDLADVTAAVDTGWPVALLIGAVIPRHWVLLVEHPDPSTLRAYNPASGRILDVRIGDIRGQTLRLGFPHAFAVVLPRSVA
jgi:hypothetical protein